MKFYAVKIDPTGKILIFVFLLTGFATLFTYYSVHIVFFALFCIFAAFVCKFLFEGLNKDSVDNVYYVLGSAGVVLLALANPFSVSDFQDRRALAEYSKRVALVQELIEFPLSVIAFSDNTPLLIKQLGWSSATLDYGELVLEVECVGAAEEPTLCEERNANSSSSLGVQNILDFLENRPVHLDLDQAMNIVSPERSLRIFHQYQFDYHFDFRLPADAVFVYLMAYDDAVEAGQVITDAARAKLVDEQKSLSYFRDRIEASTNYGQPSFWELLASLVWPLLLLIALATKLART